MLMEYETLMRGTMRAIAKTQDDLSRCHDMYRLAYILCETIAKLDSLEKLADDAVRELEGGR
jgi:hypothetical protein